MRTKRTEKLTLGNWMTAPYKVWRASQAGKEVRPGVNLLPTAREVQSHDLILSPKGTSV